jgi:hypothetical protein
MKRPSVRLPLLHHRGNIYIAVRGRLNLFADRVIRTLPGRQFNKFNRCWYIPFKPQVLTWLLHKLYPSHGDAVMDKNVNFGEYHNRMKDGNLNFNLIDSYLGLLNSLSPESKLELISKLSDSLKDSKKPTNKSISDLYGSFISRKSADQIINELKSSRVFNRNTERL